MKWKYVLILGFILYVYLKGKNESEKEGVELNPWETFLFGVRVFYKVNEENELTKKMGYVHPGYKDDPGEEMIDPDPFSFLRKTSFPDTTSKMRQPRPAFLMSKERFKNTYGYATN